MARTLSEGAQPGDRVTVTTSVRFERDTLALFRYRADVEHGVSAGEMIRRLVDEWLASGESRAAA